MDPTQPNGANGNAEPIEDMNRHGRRVQEIIEEIDSMPETPAKELVRDCVSSLLSFYGQGLERTLQIIKRAGIGGQQVYDELLHDRVVSGLLLIHGLHPVDLGTRLREALDKIRPYMESHGGNVELISLENDFARLRLIGACKTCPSSTVTMELAVRHAIEEACPDLLGFEVEGGASQSSREKQASAQWRRVAEADHLGEGRILQAGAAGFPLIICNVAGNLYAYRDRCPACNLPMHLGALNPAGILACRAGHRFSVREAGRCPDDAHLHLEPLPLVITDGRVQVAVPEENDLSLPPLEPAER